MVRCLNQKIAGEAFKQTVTADNQHTAFKGQLTIFVSMVLMLVVSIVLTVTEGARMNGIRMRTELSMDMGLNSIFAEYNRELLKQYDLFFIDTSYGAKSGSIHNTEAHLAGYMEYNLNPYKDILVANSKDWYRTSLNHVEILQASFATDDRGDVFKRQAVDYMKDKVGLSFLEELTGYVEESERYEMTTKDLSGEREDIEKQIKEIQEEQQGEEGMESLENPMDMVNATRSLGILGLVISKTEDLSYNTFAKNTFYSQRENQQGTGLPDWKENPGGLLEEQIFQEYCMDKLGYYTKPLKKGFLKYQIEYLLAGEEGDIENLKKVAHKLLLMREVANASYLYTDRSKMVEATVMAAAIAAQCMCPLLEEPLKHCILLAWAYAESVCDVKVLLEGGRIPLMKNKGEWHLELSSLLEFRDHLDRTTETDRGLDYGMYLRLLLTSMDASKKVARCMDIVEMDIQRTLGNSYFRLDRCMDSVEAEASVSSDFGYSYSIKRKYGYE